MIQVQALIKRYGQTTAVDGLTFEVRPGRVTGFLGPNGAGKSTTMRVIIGLDAPDAGRALVNGRRYRDLGWPLREVGAHLDARSFHPGLSAERHLLALARANAIDRSRVPMVLEAVGLTPAARRRAGTFSTGMAQRLGIAAALLGDPDILLFDEPINGLDPEGIRWFRQLVRGLAADGRAVLLSSHLISEMALTADWLVVIGRGRLVAELSMDELSARAPRSVRVRTSEPRRLASVLAGSGLSADPQRDGSLSITGADTDTVAEAAVAAGIVLHELTPEHASLEEVFMSLTHDSVVYQAADNGQHAVNTRPNHTRRKA
ncbi:MAG TPA: ATP-binding cassette domain-containing protein [Actinomycetota bacterium]|nr:ATP-binding cassette domain-containing protein [Actinomycetota bacterium]